MTAIDDHSPTTLEAPPGATRVSLLNIGRFLVGCRRAILQIAASRQALALGALLVLSAALAREYDGEDLWHEPWHLLIPFGASLGTSLILYTLVFVSCRRSNRSLRYANGYLQFLTLYWMTAPLAWLYAIPFERFAAAPTAIRYNLYLLALVALWRVALMIRTVMVLYGARGVQASFLVLAFADVVALTAIGLSPRPILNVMGGIRHTESEEVILSITYFIQVWGTVLLPILALGALISSLPKQASHRPAPILPPPGLVTRGTWLLAVLSVCVWAFVLPRTQSEQQNRRYVTRAMHAGRVEMALRYMSARQPADFPPQWDPPPRFTYGEWYPPFHEILAALDRVPAAPWVRRVYMQKFLGQARHLAEGYEYGPTLVSLFELSDDQLQQYVEFVQRLPEGPIVAASHHFELSDYLRVNQLREQPLKMTDRRRELLLKLNQLASVYDPARSIPVESTQ